MGADFILSPYLGSNNIIYLTFLSIRYFRTFQLQKQVGWRCAIMAAIDARKTKKKSKQKF